MRTLKLPFVETKNLKMFVILDKTPLSVLKSSTGGNKFPSVNTFLEILERGQILVGRSDRMPDDFYFLDYDFKFAGGRVGSFIQGFLLFVGHVRFMIIKSIVFSFLLEEYHQIYSKYLNKYA